MEERTKEQKENINEIMDLLRDGNKTFYWGLSEKGYGYWNEVHENLRKIRDYKENKICPHCKQEMK
jgi:hypothetical protein